MRRLRCNSEHSFSAILTPSELNSDCPSHPLGACECVTDEVRLSRQVRPLLPEQRSVFAYSMRLSLRRTSQISNAFYFSIWRMTSHVFNSEEIQPDNRLESSEWVSCKSAAPGGVVETNSGPAAAEHASAPDVVINVTIKPSGQN